MTPSPIDTAPAIRRPGPNDFEEILDVWESSVRATHFFLREEDIIVFRNLIPRYLELVDLVCTRDEEGAISGFLGTTGDKIEMLFIRADQRGKGIGRALLHHATHTLGIRKVDVNEQNGQACAFYQRAGFKTVSRSEKDGMGMPYPLLHMEWAEA